MALDYDKKIHLDHAKEEVRARINIADIIGRHVALKPVGRNLKGLCPFHKEKTPSFIVTPDKGIFHCFGCHKGGDVFTFLMEFEGLSFPEALHLMADEAGVKIETPQERGLPSSGGPDEEGGQALPMVVSKNEMFRINALAMEFFYRSTRGNQKAIDYFLGRGLSRETIRDFRLGYAPGGWSELITHAKKQGVSEAALVQCGLAIAKDGGRAYDRFRDRIMFPILDTSRRPIGFGGRGLDADAQPKYLNSPETLLYQKTRTLYGLHSAQYHIKQAKSVIVVEGYMDFLALHQAGVRNVIATSGTALTEVQARIIQRFTNKVHLVFDGDAAGIGAAQRAVFVLAPHNFDIRVLVLPGGEDPDDFVKGRGAQAFLSILDTARPFMEFIIGKSISDKGVSTPQQKSALLDSLVPLAKSITDSLVRREFIKQLAEGLGIGEAVVIGRMKKGPLAPRETAPAFASDAYGGTLEGQFIWQLIAEPSIIDEARRFVTPEILTDPFSSGLYSIILQCHDENPQLPTLMDRLPDSETKRIVSLLIAKGKFVGDAQFESNVHKALQDTVMRLQRKFLMNKRKLNKARMINEPQNLAALLKQSIADRLQIKELEE